MSMSAKANTPFDERESKHINAWAISMTAKTNVSIHGHEYESKHINARTWAQKLCITKQCMNMTEHESKHINVQRMSTKANTSLHEYGSKNKHVRTLYALLYDHGNKRIVAWVRKRAKIPMHGYDHENKHINAWTWVRKQTYYAY